MALFTRKGDDGVTELLSSKDRLASDWTCNQKISKNSKIIEALGSLDEANSFLGLCKVQSAYLGFKLGKTSLAEIVHEMQKNLFIIQAELAGADKTIDKSKIDELEEIIINIEKELPPIKSFFISGGPVEITKWQQSGAGLGAIFDIARTIVRRTERRVIAVVEEIAQPTLPVSELKSVSAEDFTGEISKTTKSYLNRLSSALYALARYANHKVGIMEEAPDYR